MTLQLINVQSGLYATQSTSDNIGWVRPFMHDITMG